MLSFKNPLDSKPLAAPGLLSYRCKSAFGWIMIGAKDDDDAFVQAKRSNVKAKREDLQIWNGSTYVSCPKFDASNDELVQSEPSKELATMRHRP